jgi:hypothetical protein
MKTLTDEQAFALRELRPTIRPVVASLKTFGERMREVCPHEDESVPGCPVCELELIVARAERLIAELADRTDFHLTRGPEPRAAK